MHKNFKEHLQFTKEHRKTILKDISIFLLILSFFIIGNFFYSRSICKVQIQSTAHHIDNIFKKELQSFESDNRFLNQQIQSIVNNHGSDSLLIKTLLQNFSVNKTIYHQLRLLDKDGYERFRYDHDTDTKKSIFITQLQNKSHRYYFQLGQQLNKNEIVFSKIDLYVENHKIEIPHRPMLRIISPVFVEGGQKAVLVSNANVKYIFRKIKEEHSGVGQHYLINNESYYLMHPQQDLCFGFMEGMSGSKFTDDMEVEQLSDLPKAQFFFKNGSEYYITAIDFYNLDENKYAKGKFKQDILKNKYYYVYEITWLQILKTTLLSKNMFFALIVSLIILISLYFNSYSDFKKQSLKEQLIFKNKELKTNNQTLKNLIDAASHDFRSPYSNIISLIDLIEEHNDLSSSNNKGEIQYLASRIKNISFRSIQMLDNLLTWSKLQINAIDINNKRFQLKEIITPIIAFNELLFENKQIKYKFNLEESVEIYSDKESLSVVLRNLISNASKYSHEKSEINIEIYSLKNNTVIKVQDHGIGMTEDQIRKLTDRNQAYTTQGTSGEKGNGVGMNLVFDFANKLGGYISIESELGKGSTFKFHLPIH
jgi:signal transduction histidine kinase